MHAEQRRDRGRSREEEGSGVRVCDRGTHSELGEKKFQAVSQEGVTRSITAQVYAGNMALMSVKQVMRAGNRVVFDKEGTYIKDKVIGEKIWAADDGGMFMVKMWVSRKAGY